MRDAMQSFIAASRIQQRISLLVLAVALPLSLSSSVQANQDTQPFARIAYVKWVCRDDMSVIVAADVTGRHREMITRAERCRHFGADEAGREDHAPGWSPDGNSVAFTRDVRKRGVYIWRRGTGERRIDTRLVDHRPVWSPDGRWLVLATSKSFLAHEQSRRG